jgi:hypothetical protein
MPELPRLSKKNTMTIDEDRQACTESIVYGCTTTSAFRTRKANEYPDDLRNSRAADTLKQFAKDAVDTSTDNWEMLQHHYNSDSREWQDALSLATKEVGLSNRSKSDAYFIQRLIRCLSSSVAA